MNMEVKTKIRDAEEAYFENRYRIWRVKEKTWCIVDEDWKWINTDLDKKRGRWKQHIMELYIDEGLNLETNEAITVAVITLDE